MSFSSYGVSEQAAQRLKQYQSLLLRWQKKINLISPNTVEDSWARHFEDSLQLLSLIPDKAKSLYDLGSGAGFPGLALAMARQDLGATLIESDAKKCAFLSTVSRETATTVKIENNRIEVAAANLPAPDIVTARALASLSALFLYVWPWAQANGDMVLLFPKGANWRTEVEEARHTGWSFNLVDRPSKTDRDARLLMFTNLRKSSV